MTKKSSDKNAIEGALRTPSPLKSQIQQSGLSDRSAPVVHSKPDTSGKKILNLSLPNEWHEALEDYCREFSRDHVDFNRFQPYITGSYLKKRAVVNALIAEFLGKSGKSNE